MGMYLFERQTINLGNELSKKIQRLAFVEPN